MPLETLAAQIAGNGTAKPAAEAAASPDATDPSRRPGRVRAVVNRHAMAETGAARYLLAFIYSGCKSQLAECRVLLSAARAEQRLPGARKLPPEAADEIASGPCKKGLPNLKAQPQVSSPIGRKNTDAGAQWASH